MDKIIAASLVTLTLCLGTVSQAATERGPKAGRITAFASSSKAKVSAATQRVVDKLMDAQVRHSGKIAVASAVLATGASWTAITNNSSNMKLGMCLAGGSLFANAIAHTAIWFSEKILR